MFGFCKTFQKTNKIIDWEPTFKQADLQDIIFTTYANPINVTVDNLYLHIPIFVPSAKTKALVIESIQNSWTLVYLIWFLVDWRKKFNSALDFQVGIGSAQLVKNPKFLIAIYLLAAGIDAPNKANNIALFEDRYVR